MTSADYRMNSAAQGASPGGTNLLRRIQKISIEFGPGLKDVQNFTNQLAVMIKAGIDIRSAIGGVADQIQNRKFHKVVEHIKIDVESGKSFSEALSHHGNVFSPLYINMIRASELSGNFAEMLGRISDYLAEQIETRRMVTGAMIYPAIIGTMAVVTTVFLLTFVLPKFTKLFEGKEQLLPMPTKVLMAISGFLRTYWYVVVGGLVAIGVAVRFYISTPAGRELWDKTKLRLPLLKRVLRALYISRGVHTMGELVGAGVPMLETLRITADVSDNTLYKRMWTTVCEAVKEGDKIVAPLSKQGLLPKSVVQMIAAGEESGSLSEVLNDISEYYARELKSTIKTVTAMLEPLMIVIMGLVVGFIAMSVILPIFKMSGLVK